MRILGIDYGDVRVGLALSDISGVLAGGIGTLKITGMKDAVKQVTAVVKEKQVQKIVLGLPKNMDGSEGASAGKIRAFAELLEKELPDVPILFWDERRTSILAAGYMTETGTFGKKRKESVDTLSAQIILQSRLDHEKAAKGEES